MTANDESLPAALADPQSDVRRRALLRVAESRADGPAVRAAVRTALADPVWCVREAAAVAVGGFADPDGVILSELVRLTLTDSSPLVRRAAAAAAGPRIEPERDYGTAARHRFERQRIRAATALGHVPEERKAEAARLLAGCLTDHHPKVRFAALEALERLEPTALLPLVATVVRKCAESDVRIAAAARRVWLRVLTAPRAEPVRPLAPFPGTDDAPGAQAALDALPPDHPLQRAADALGRPPAGANAARLARHLATVCARVLGTTRGAPS
jgi:HEAT repeat protein